MVKQFNLWYCNRYKEHISHDDITLILGNMNLGFFKNRSIPIPIVCPFILPNATVDAHISANTNPGMDVEP